MQIWELFIFESDYYLLIPTDTNSDIKRIWLIPPPAYKTCKCHLYIQQQQVHYQRPLRLCQQSAPLVSLSDNMQPMITHIMDCEYTLKSNVAHKV